MSNVRELRKNLVDKVCELGVGSAFVSHPAFIPTLSGIDGLISNMNVSDPESVHVREHDGMIAFDYTDSAGDKYSFELTAGEDFVKCVRVEEPHSYVGNSGSVVRVKHAIEKVAKVDDYGSVTITTNFGSIDNVNCDNLHYNMSSSVETCVYDRNGVMHERESRHYGSRLGNGYFHRVGANELLSYARWAPQYDRWNNTVTSRTLLRREKLDTARVVYEDKTTRHIHYGVVPLDQQHGLRDMFIANGYNTYPVPDVTIHPLMQSEVDAMIAREADERVANGLREYAVGRTTYSYSSNNGNKTSVAVRVM